MGEGIGALGRRITYNASISACEKGEQWVKALELMEEVRSSRLRPDVSTYSAAISACDACNQRL